eukprot:CAMPEP_0206222764 /NCGR_PEP_ID=MMETSP0047_2-20121206/6128_1 /ASSEMBLY_ACC=CAM_ASM_000192 /TAXON_ID=195065 /ORGANISM="Chroomonas mesostigmatica_cf, Strain CCMP1168" /LENGTH=44 /DNA_ID= /DNA_START= /DNA_END= /DNA_ORIENTATION=
MEIIKHGTTAVLKASRPPAKHMRQWRHLLATVASPACSGVILLA